MIQLFSFIFTYHVGPDKAWTLAPNLSNKIQTNNIACIQTVCTSDTKGRAELDRFGANTDENHIGYRLTSFPFCQYFILLHQRYLPILPQSHQCCTLEDSQTK